jgi:hypothetical protein
VIFLPTLPSFVTSRCVDSLVPTRHAYCCTHRVPDSWLGNGDTAACSLCGSTRNAAVIAFSPDLREFELADARDLAGRITRFLVLEGSTVPAVLASHVVVLEARAAVRPEVLDSEDTRLLHRNLWLTALLAMDGGAPRLSELPTPLESIVGGCMALLAGDRTAAVTWAVLGQALQPDGWTVTIARQLLLFGHFMLGLPLARDAVDWDAVLELDSLMAIFICAIPLAPSPPPVAIVPLADDWVDLLMPPYELDIGNMGSSTGLCLLTGTRIALSPNLAEGGTVPLVEYIHETWKNGPVLILNVTGDHASEIKYASLEFSLFFNAPDAWLDKNGTPDQGLRLGKLLSLNRAVLAEILDDYLSGKFYGKRE